MLIPDESWTVWSPLELRLFVRAASVSSDGDEGHSERDMGSAESDERVADSSCSSGAAVAVAGGTNESGDVGGNWSSIGSKSWTASDERGERALGELDNVETVGAPGADAAHMVGDEGSTWHEGGDGVGWWVEAAGKRGMESRCLIYALRHGCPSSAFRRPCRKAEVERAERWPQADRIHPRPLFGKRDPIRR